MVNKTLEKFKKKLQRRKTKKKRERAKGAADRNRKRRRIRQNDPDGVNEKARAAAYQARQIGGELGITTDKAANAADSAADALEGAVGPPDDGGGGRQPSLPEFAGVEPGSGGDAPQPYVPGPGQDSGGGGAGGRVPETVLELGGEGYDREPVVPETVFPEGDSRDNEPPFF